MQFVGVSAYSAGGVDGHGQQVPTWAPEQVVAVDWVAPWQSSEVPDGERQSVVIGVQICTADAVASPRDRIIWPYPGGDTFDVDGQPADWRHGPWQNNAARVITNCRRVEG